MARPRAAIVLAAGKGKRMKSEIPKVLHRIHGRSMISMVIDTLGALKFDKIVVVVGFKGEMVEQELKDYPVTIVWQRKQLGTGHAVMMARDALGDFDGTTLVALGDVPFLSSQTIEQLFVTHDRTEAKATCLSVVLDDPTGYGRIVRECNSDILQEIVEHRDASEEILEINEINTGTFCFDNRLLFDTLTQIDNDNSQGEYYLTDCVKILYSSGFRVSVTTAANPDEGMGVNSAEQLAELARKFEAEK
ncbi:MAG: NTP transferase domain-containing protein [Candidatus Zixiibacteriota bacterium]|nr:MAG: NTP transferase domain-containing protein [candidate division Zixibacteria bacterium]